MNSDDRAGLEIAKELDRIIAKKTAQPALTLVLFGILAGVYIGFGAAAATTVTTFEGLPQRLLNPFQSTAPAPLRATRSFYCRGRGGVRRSRTARGRAQ